MTDTLDVEKMKSQFDLDNNLNNLYHISLQYYTLLKKKEHPMIHLIANIMDNLIVLKKESIIDPKEKLNIFNEIHALAYKNIDLIYEYDKDIDEKNGISSEPGKLDVKIGIEYGDEKKDENNDVEVVKESILNLDNEILN